MLFQRPPSQWTETRIRSFFDRIVAATSHQKPDEAAPLLTNRTRRLPSNGESQLVSHWVLRQRFAGEAPPSFLRRIESGNFAAVLFTASFLGNAGHRACGPARVTGVR